MDVQWVQRRSWHAIRSAVGETRRLDVDPGVHPEAFLEFLEAEGFTVMPLEIRRACDLWGVAGITKTMDGYALIDPTKLRVVP